MTEKEFKQMLPYGAFETAREAGLQIGTHPGDQVKAAFKKINWVLQLAEANGIFLEITQKNQTLTSKP
jgi:hypothetical protein